jgi:hypothetical protein
MGLRKFARTFSFTEVRGRLIDKMKQNVMTLEDLAFIKQY